MISMRPRTLAVSVSELCSTLIADVVGMLNHAIHIKHRKMFRDWTLFIGLTQMLLSFSVVECSSGLLALQDQVLR